MTWALWSWASSQNCDDQIQPLCKSTLKAIKCYANISNFLNIFKVKYNSHIEKHIIIPFKLQLCFLSRHYTFVFPSHLTIPPKLPVQCWLVFIMNGCYSGLLIQTQNSLEEFVEPLLNPIISPLKTICLSLLWLLLRLCFCHQFCSASLRWV